ncbi:MAG: iron chelate uptake ABC transporter family permease subunit [Thalassovita sp.]
MFDRRLVALSLVLVLCCAVFLGWDLKGRVWFILELRATKLAGLVLVGASIGLATVLFQTLSANRILTPSIMGFDALFLLMQTVLLLALGGSVYVQLGGPVEFLIETSVMMIAAAVLFGTVLGHGTQDLHRMILTGVIFAVLFQSLRAFLVRIIDPNDFAVLQGEMFASFGAIDQHQLAIAGLCFAVVVGGMLRFVAELDVIALGRPHAISLGVSFKWRQIQILFAIAILVSISTALVGPVTFLGLLVTSLTHALMRTHEHRLLLPAAALIAASILVAGQFAFERVLKMQSTLSILIEFFGGLLFLILVLRGKAR